MEIIDKESIYGDENNAVVLCEYSIELKLIKQLIDFAQDGINKQIIKGTDSFEGVCHLLAKTVVSYSKMAYDNLLLGHFHAVHMINRSILENCVFLDVIINNDKEELWKYYLVYSYYNTINKSSKYHKMRLDAIKQLYKDYRIEEEFYTKQPNQKKAYICKPYGWTYKVNKNFNFKGVCGLVGEGAAMGFELMSRYSHGTSIDLKICSSVFEDNIISMLVSIYIELYKMVRLYCWGDMDDEFDKTAEDFENIIYDYIDYSEEHFYKD